MLKKLRAKYFYISLNFYIKLLSDLMKNIDKIESYYINLAGDKQMKKGNPLMSFEHVFNDVGLFKVFIALKFNNGDTIDNEIEINAKELSFSDFKKIHQ